MLSMPFKSNVTVYSKKTFDAFRDLRRGPEEYTDVLQRLVDEHYQFEFLKTILTPSQQEKLAKFSKKDDPEPVEVLAR